MSMSTDTIADNLTGLYEGFGPQTTGEDYALGVNASEASVAAEQARYWGMVNDARKSLGVIEWDGLLCEATLKARAESNPELLADRLLELAAIAVTYANSVQRQVNDFDVEEPRKSKGK